MSKQYQSRSDLEFHPQKEMCPCGESKNFQALKGDSKRTYSSGGKCFRASCVHGDDSKGFFFPDEWHEENQRRGKRTTPKATQPKPTKPKESKRMSIPTNRSVLKTEKRFHVYRDYSTSEQIHAVEVQVKIFDDGTREKTPYQKHWNGAKWENGLKYKSGENAGKPVPRLLYNGDKIQAIRNNGEQALRETVVLVCEGEKDCDTFHDQAKEHLRNGIVAVTNPMGATKFLPEHAEQLQGFRCVVAIDNDNAGREHGKQVLSLLHDKAREIQVLDFGRYKDLKKGYDLADYLQDYASEQSADFFAGLANCGFQIDTAENWLAWVQKPEAKKETFTTNTQAGIQTSTYEDGLQQGMKQEKERKKKNKQIQLEEWLSENYDLRYNEVLSCVEIRDKGQKTFVEMTDKKQNSMYRQARKAEIPFTDIAFKNTINSDFAESYHPFKEYFFSLPKWDGEDRILQMAETLPVHKEQEGAFRSVYLKKWLVGMVATAIEYERHGRYWVNENILVLAGKQGVGKTTWVRRILPKFLRQYMTETMGELKGKDFYMKSSRNILCSLDELRGMHKEEISALKANVSQKEMKERFAFEQYVKSIKRHASFIGTVDTFDFLRDSAGSRRFLCVEVLPRKIDIAEYENSFYEQLYAQCMYLLHETDFTIYHTPGQQAEIEKMNLSFSHVSVEFELLSEYFTESEKEEDFWTATNVLRYLRQNEPNLPNIYERGVGVALTRLFGERVPKKVNGVPIKGYKIKPKKGTAMYASLGVN